MSGVANFIADVLSRARLQNNSIHSDSIIHSDESSSHKLILSVGAPIIVFKNHFFFKENTDPYYFEIPFPTYHRHIIKKNFYTESSGNPKFTKSPIRFQNYQWYQILEEIMKNSISLTYLQYLNTSIPTNLGLIVIKLKM